MLNKPFLCFLGAVLAALPVFSAEIDVKCKFYTAKLNLQGGRLVEVVRNSDKQIFTTPTQTTFTERVFIAGDPAAPSEEFSSLEYKLVSQKDNYPVQSITLSASGTAAFDYIKVTKTYNFVYNKPAFSVDYTVENLADKPMPAGLWVKTTFCNYDPTGSLNEVFMPDTKGGMTKLINPGNPLTDNFIADPAYGIAAIAGVGEKSSGCVMNFTPGNLLGGFYGWLGNSKPAVRSLEYLTREMDIPAKGKFSFTISVNISDKAIQTAERMAKNPKAKITARDGRPITFFNAKGLPQLKTPLDGQMPKHANSADFTVARGFNDSVRAVRIPGNIKLENPAVYEVYNGVIDHGNPLPVNVKKLDGKTNLLLFKVPGARPTLGTRTTIKNNLYSDIRNLQYFGRNLTTVRVIPQTGEKSPALDASEPELVINGNFEKFDAKNNPVYPDKWRWENTISKKVMTMVKEGPDGSNCIKLKKAGKNVAVYSMDFPVEPNRLYKVSADIRCDNLNRTPVFAFVHLCDEKNKFIPKSRQTFFSGKGGTAWKRFSGEYMMPANARFMTVGFQLHQSGPDNVMWVDNISVKPVDFEFVPKSKLTLAKEAIIRSGYKPIDILEKISHELVTPHEKWFKPAASAMPDMLYFSVILHNPGDIHRRNIVEMAQRMDFKYEFIPLLPKTRGTVRPGHGFGVYEQLLEDVIDDYVFVRIDELKAIPKVTMVQGLDFARYDKNKRFTKTLQAIQKKSNLVFVDCKNIPVELTGKKVALPESWKLVPLMNKAAQWAAHVQKYEKASAFNYGDVQYIRLSDFPSTPYAERANFSPSYVSRDFPFWEYRFLPLLKAVREAGACDTPAVFSRFNHSGDTLELTLDAKRAEKVKVLCNFKNFNRFDDGSVSSEVNLTTGANEVQLKLPQLPGGDHLAYFYLLDSKGGIYDAGAMNFATPEPVKLTLTYPNAKRILPADKSSEIVINCNDPAAGDTIYVDVEDTEFRIVQTHKFKAAKSVRIDFKPQVPRTLLYRILVRMEKAGKVVARSMGEVSVPTKLDPTDFHAGIWAGRRILAQLYKNLGFELVSIDGRSSNIKNGLLANAANLNMYPLVLNIGLYNNHNGLNYRTDRPSDPVRNPCYSDAALNADTQKKISDQIEKTSLDYYAGYYHMLGDEMFLGSMVCYAEHCLKDFRKELEAEYKTIDALNKNWNTSFKSFSEVMPMQLAEAQKHGNLAPWISHKTFMNKVYAHKAQGIRVEAVKKSIPGAQVGLSGTQVPGYSYDWAQLMKQFDCLAFYAGIQRTLICDFAKPGIIMGEWGGGYVGPHALYDAYQRSDHWSNLMKGANSCFHWHGSAILGDGTATENFKVYSEEFNVLKSGIAKMLLTAEKRDPKIAILYSQSSLFAAMGTSFQLVRWMHTQTGWDEMLRDLKYDATFITYEQLADSKFDLSRFKVIVLPMALSLSQSERERLVKFTEAGGTVIADAAPGRFDQHGARAANTVLDKLFPANTRELAPLSKDIKQGDLTSRFLIAEPELPVYTVRNVGKGKAVLLNIIFDAYQTLTLGGVGGEHSTSTTGTEQYCNALRTVVSKIMTDAGLKVYAVVKDNRGRLAPSESVLRKNGENYYFGIMYRDLLSEKIPGRIDFKNATPVTVELPISGVIYDVRRGVKLGKGNKFKTTLPAGYGQLFAVLPAEITAVKTQLPPSVKAGSVCSVKVSADGAADKSVFRMEVYTPDGKKQPLYSKNQVSENKETVFSFQIPYNAEKGKWNLVFTHAASGKKSNRLVTVK